MFFALIGFSSVVVLLVHLVLALTHFFYASPPNEQRSEGGKLQVPAAG